MKGPTLDLRKGQRVRTFTSLARRSIFRSECDQKREGRPGKAVQRKIERGARHEQVPYPNIFACRAFGLLGAERDAMTKSLGIKGRGKRAGGSTPTVPLAYSVPGLSSATSAGKDKIYGAIRRGDLIARKFGKRTLILHPDAVNWLASLPLYPAGDQDNE